MACFRVRGCECAVDVLRIAEVLRPVPVTPLPQAPPFVEGLIELRGRFLPLIDLRRRFAAQAAHAVVAGEAVARAGGDRPPEPEPESESGKYIVAPLCGTPVALVVDDVSGVERVPADLIQPPPTLASGRLAPAFVSGVVRWNDRVLMVLDLEAILTEEEQRSLAAM
jgi:purine-binding chemotaxis protein CheW